MIPFNKPYLTGNETKYIEEAVRSGKISGNGKYTKLCQSFLKTDITLKGAINNIMHRCARNGCYFNRLKRR